MRASDVSVRLGRIQALDRVELSLEPGRAVMLVGPNGAGKSTLIKVLLGLVRPDRGRFEIDGQRVEIDNDWKRRIGYLPEAVSFPDNLSGGQLIRFFARARGVGRDRETAVLERVGLADARRRAIRGYSRGMRQRLGLGVAILATPELLVLDEPTSGLDQQGLSVLWSVIDEWRDAGRGILTSSHDLALMERRIDEICVLREGRVLAHGSGETLRRAAGVPHCIWFDTGDAPDARVDLLCEAMRKWGKGRIEREGDRVRAEVFSDDVLELVEIQTGFPGVVRSMRVEEPTLDLVYDRLLGAA